MRRRAVLLLLLLVHLLPAAAGAQVAEAPSRGDITLSPGDLIRVKVYREEDLNGEFVIDPDGRVILPLIGERTVVGIPVRQLREQLVQAYLVHLRNPSIEITPLRRILVLGEVPRPGMYTIDPTVSLADAVALAGGPTPSGSIDHIHVVRDGKRVVERASMGLTIHGADIRSGDQIMVGRRSWFDRNSTFLVSTTLSLTSIIVALLTR